MERKSSILGGALLLTGANLVMRLIVIAFNAFLGKRIGPEGLGQLQLITTVGMFAILVGTSGVRVAAMCLSAEEFGHQRLGGVRLAMSVCLRCGLLLSLLAGGLLFLLAPLLAARLPGNSDVTLSLRITGLFLPATCLSGVMSGYFTACGRIRRLVVFDVLDQLFSVGITAVLLSLWAGASSERACASIVLGNKLGTVFFVTVLFCLYRKELGDVPLPPGRGGMARRLRELSVPLALNDYLRAGLNTAEQLLIPHGLGRSGLSSARAMADYGTIHAMVFPILMFPATILFSVAELLVPELARSRATDRRRRIVDLTNKCLRLTVLFSAGVAGFLFVSAQTLGQWIYGSAAAGRYLRIFSPMVLPLYLDAITDGMLKGLSEQVASVRYNTVTSLLDVALLVVLLPRWGLGGYVVSFALTHGINLLLSLRRLLLVTGHRVRCADVTLPLLCAGGSAWLSTALQGNGLARGVLFLLLLLSLYLFTDAISAGERSWLWGLIKKTPGIRRAAKRRAGR